MIASQKSIRCEALVSTFLSIVGLLALDSTAVRAQNAGDWQTAPTLVGGGGDWDNSNNNSLGGSATWQIFTNGAWLTVTGNLGGTGYPSNNTGVVTILTGTTITNATASGSGIVADGITVQSGASFQILKGVFTVAHSGSTTYDLDVFGTMGLEDTSATGVSLQTGATIAVENGATMTNFGTTSGDNFTGSGYATSAITFLNGSLYVQAGMTKGTIPKATWNNGSTFLMAPPAAGAYVPLGLSGQNFYNFTWNWPTQNAKTGGSAQGGSLTVRGNFTFASSDGFVVEDIPYSGNTLTVLGNIGITNAIWYPTAAAGVVNVQVGGNLIVETNATIGINSGGGTGAVLFNGTSPQTFGIYGTNSSPGSWDWTVAGGSTVNIDFTMTNNSSTNGSGFITNNGTLNLTANGSVTGSGTVFIAPGAIFNVSTNSNGFNMPGNETLLGGGEVIGNVTATNGATIHPGSGRTLTIAGNLNLNTKPTNIFDLTSSAISGNDQIVLNATGSTLAAGNAQVTINSAGTLASADYVFYNVTGSGGSISGAFNATPAWAGTPPANSNSFSIVTTSTQVLLHYGVVTVPPPGITGVSVAGSNLVISGTNGVAGNYVVLMNTNLTLKTWVPVATNAVTGSGSFSFIATNAVTPGSPQQFYILQAP